MKNKIIFLFIILISCSKRDVIDYPIKPISFTQVKINDQFWKPRMEINRTVTIPSAFKKCEETGRIANFEIAGGLKEGEFQSGRHYDDSDVYKIIEGAAYSLATFPDPKLEFYLDDLISKIAAAQEDDGYLMTWRTIDPNKPPAKSAGGPERWSNITHGHELYNVGHMYEAAVAFYLSTGKRSLLDVAVKNADLVVKTFGPYGIKIPPGHEEIEIGLVKLYRVTGNEKYLNLARFFVEQRGNAEGHELLGLYHQDHQPLKDQHEAVGHAVRAGYFYSGVADVAALTGQPQFIESIDSIWQNVVSKKLYLTGGIGASRQGEAFGDNYQLPNATAYNETCAAIANIFWNHRMFLLKGDSKYIDVLERTLYNGMLSGVSLAGDTYFYPNPLEFDGLSPFNQGTGERKAWFNTSCCPSNVSRFIPSVPGYVYAKKENSIYVNLFVDSEAQIEIKSNSVVVKQETNYPWSGAVRLFILPKKENNFTVKLRIPGWAVNKPVPSDLYGYFGSVTKDVSIKINGETIQPDLVNGYVVLSRSWKKMDLIELELPMDIHRVKANELILEDAGKIAFERGPIVYAAEAVDNFGKISNLTVDPADKMVSQFQQHLLNGVTVLQGQALRTDQQNKKQEFRLIPYYAWDHRGVGEMTVWLPLKK